LHIEYEKLYEKYPPERAALKELVDHIDYVVKRVGARHVGIGTDFDGGGDIDGIEDVSQMPRLTEELLRRGYEEEDLRLIWGENTMRVLREVMEVAERIQSQRKPE
jgi:membrane dipeptidase